MPTHISTFLAAMETTTMAATNSGIDLRFLPQSPLPYFPVSSSPPPIDCPPPAHQQPAFNPAHHHASPPPPPYQPPSATPFQPPPQPLLTQLTYAASPYLTSISLLPY
jgi:hypothetical protein